MGTRLVIIVFNSMQMKYILSFRVLVLDEGKTKEFDTPEELLCLEDGIFYNMIKDAGLIDSFTSYHKWNNK